ncbi:MAG: hypothetical protein CMC76_12480 [Flavobacteriaceae bacterium]|nr:hypothetical protein [Flavobacteriaceae bacterium]
MRGLARNFASTHQTENPRGFSEVGENKQLLIAIVGHSIFLNSVYKFILYSNFAPSALKINCSSVIALPLILYSIFSLLNILPFGENPLVILNSFVFSISK